MIFWIDINILELFLIIKAVMFSFHFFLRKQNVGSPNSIYETGLITSCWFQLQQQNPSITTDQMNFNKYGFFRGNFIKIDNYIDFFTQSQKMLIFDQYL